MGEDGLLEYGQVVQIPSVVGVVLFQPGLGPPVVVRLPREPAAHLAGDEVGPVLDGDSRLLVNYTLPELLLHHRVRHLLSLFVYI